MTLDQERRWLAAMLAARNRPPASRMRRTIVLIAVWLLLAVAIFAMLRYNGVPAKREAIWLGVAFVLGAGVAVWSMLDAVRGQWQAMKGYIDYDAIEARIAEIERAGR